MTYQSSTNKLELLRLIVGAEESLQLIGGTTTHDAGLRLTAKMVARGYDDDVIQRAIPSLFPEDYRGDSLTQIQEWIKSARRKGFDKSDSPNKDGQRRSPSDVLIDLFEQSGATLFHDQHKRAYMTVRVESDGFRHIGLTSSEGRLWLTKTFYEAQRRTLSGTSLDNAIATLEARARFDGNEYRTVQRVGGVGNTVSVDLGRADGRVVRITPGGWDVTADADTKFVRSPGFGELPIPRRTKGSLRKLMRLLGLDEHTWSLVLAFLIGCMKPDGPYMCLLIEGEQGSGKSVLASAIKKIIDPNAVDRFRLPESERDLMIHAQDYFLLVFDNVSGMKGDLSDALCVLATGGGLATRKLYTDNELFVFKSARPFLINGIADFVQRPDLLERAIPLKLPPLRKGARKTETEITLKFDQLLPGVLGELYDLIAAALRNSSGRVRTLGLRMADAERWIAAAVMGSDLKPGSFLSAIKSAQDQMSTERVNSDYVVTKLLEKLSKGPFEGTLMQLYAALSSFDYQMDRQLPKTPAHLSRHLTRMKPMMEGIGLNIEFGTRTNRGRTIRCWLKGQEQQRPQEHDKPLPSY